MEAELKSCIGTEGRGGMKSTMYESVCVMSERDSDAEEDTIEWRKLKPHPNS